MTQPTTTTAVAADAPPKFVGLAWSSLILGIVGLVFSPLPIVNNISALVAVVGIVLAFIAVFGSRTWLALIGGGLCVLAVVATVAKQDHDVKQLDAALGQLGAPPAVPAPVQAAAPVVPAPPAAGPATSFGGDGTYVVGQDIQVGTYKTAGPAPGYFQHCYWERQKNTDGEFGSIIANGGGEGPATVTVKKSDGAFKTQGCQAWHKVR